MNYMIGNSEVAPRAVVRDQTLNGILMSKRYVEGSLPNQKFAVEPTDDWNKINKFDKEHQVKTKTIIPEGKKTKEVEKQMALSDYLLANVSEMTKLAFKNGNITENDLKVAVQLRDRNNQPYLDKKGKPVEDHPLAFIKVEGDKLVIPDNLTAQQRVDLMTLVYNSATSTKDFSERPNKAGLGKILLEEITRSYDKFEKAGKLDKKSGLVTGKYEANDVLLSLNIALRKGIEKNLEVQAYSLTKDYVRDDETPIQRLKNRLKIASGVGLSKVKHAGEMRTHTDVFQGAKGENKTIPSEVEIDLLMAQAFDVLVPPDARFQMVKDQMVIDNTADYRQKAALKKDLAKNKQMWRMAILRHYNIGAAPGRPSIAEEINDQRIFSSNEADKIDHDFRLKIGKRIDELERANKKSGGFNELDISKANLIYSRELLNKALESNQVLLGKVEASLTKMLLRSGELVSGKHTVEEMHNLKKQIFTETGLIVGKNVEQDAIVTRILENALSTQVSLERKLIKMGKINKANIKAEDVKFGTNIQPAIKGVGLLYRRGVTEIISEANRFDDPNSKGKPNYTMVEDSDRNLHISSTGRKPSGRNVDISSSASMIQGEKKISKDKLKTTKNRKVSPAPAATETQSPEEIAEAQKELDEQTIKLAKVLDVKKDVKNLEELSEELTNAGIIEMKRGDKGLEMHVNIKAIDLISIVDLETLSSLSKLYPEATIQIDSLNYSPNEGETSDIALNSFNIESLTIDTTSAGQEVNLTTRNTKIVDLIVNGGVEGNIVTLNTDIPPRFVSVNDGSEANIIFNNQQDLENALSTNFQDGKLFARNNGKLNISYKEGGVIKTVLNFAGERKNEDLVFIKENDVYELVNSNHQFPAAEAAGEAPSISNILGKVPPPIPEQSTEETLKATLEKAAEERGEKPVIKVGRPVEELAVENSSAALAESVLADTDPFTEEATSQVPPEFVLKMQGTTSKQWIAETAAELRQKAENVAKAAEERYDEAHKDDVVPTPPAATAVEWSVNAIPEEYIQRATEEAPPTFILKPGPDRDDWIQQRALEMKILDDSITFAHPTPTPAEASVPVEAKPEDKGDLFKLFDKPQENNGLPDYLDEVQKNALSASDEGKKDNAHLSEAFEEGKPLNVAEVGENLERSKSALDKLPKKQEDQKEEPLNNLTQILEADGFLEKPEPKKKSFGERIEETRKKLQSLIPKKPVPPVATPQPEPQASKPENLDLPPQKPTRRRRGII